jgi:hypothetical protein
VAEVKKRPRPGLRRRLVDAAAGGVVGDLFARVEELEAAVQENRNLNLRVAELVDLVQELMLPVAAQDKDKIDAALEKFQRSL